MSEPEPLKDSFCFRVFEKSKSIAEGVRDTDFLKAIKKNNLPPTNWGVLNVQEAYYCYRVSDTYGSFLTKINSKEDSELYALVKLIIRRIKMMRQPQVSKCKRKP